MKTWAKYFSLTGGP